MGGPQCALNQRFDFPLKKMGIRWREDFTPERSKRERDKEARKKKPTTERREQMGGNKRKTQRKR